MEKLTAFEKKWSKRLRSVGRGCWLGGIGNCPANGRVLEIARRAGYSPGSASDFFEIDRKTASRVLAYLQKESLAYGQHRYREGLVREMFDMLGEMGSGARFCSNSRHSDFASDNPPDASNAWMWVGLTEATFDTGVIALNEATGFMFWMEEDD